ncbi:MAG TPA: hypothetical protein VFQ61_34115 [Polyangiaceae bacterium]|nr:hypothetical protein [Polyangiaceae bacterium]
MGLFERAKPLKDIVQRGASAVRRAAEGLSENGSAIEAKRDAPLAEEGPEPPVVARLVVEIRSDGSRTIARGGLEDVISGQKVAVRADGTTPAQLARSLASTLVTLPVFAARIARSLKRGEELKIDARPDSTRDEHD